MFYLLLPENTANTCWSAEWSLDIGVFSLPSLLGSTSANRECFVGYQELSALPRCFSYHFQASWTQQRIIISLNLLSNLPTCLSYFKQYKPPWKTQKLHKSSKVKVISWALLKFGNKGKSPSCFRISQPFNIHSVKWGEGRQRYQCKKVSILISKHYTYVPYSFRLFETSRKWWSKKNSG